MDIRRKVSDMLDEFDTAMMITHAGSGPLDCRPMQVAESEVQRGGPLWFITSAESRKVVELASNATLLLIFQDVSRYLAVWGRARVLNDRERTARLWKEPYRVWFPEGVDDPDIRLISVQPHSAEFWDNAGANKVRYLFEAAQAYATGERVAVDDEQHGRTNL
jgi:general stress protein 26